MQYAGTNVLVTGASSGLGAQFAQAFAERGADIVLVARRSALIDDLARRLRDRHGVAVEALAHDLGEAQPGVRLHEALGQRGITVSTLVNCAGIGATGPFAGTPADVVDAQVAVNVAAVVDLSRAFLPDLLARGDGALVNVASLTGHAPAPGMAVYGATKAFVLSFTEALAHELRHEPLRVLALSPGPTRTGFYAASGTSEAAARFQGPEEVVAEALRALEGRRPRTSVVSGRSNRFSAGLMRHLPRPLLMRAVTRALRPAV